MSETVADILREMRDRANGLEHNKLGQIFADAFIRLLREYADRIEAAWKREVADALDTGAFVEAAHKRETQKSLRNCDIGTPHEQSSRFDKFCFGKYGHGCVDCPLVKCRSCELAWAQMPYTGGEK